MRQIFSLLPSKVGFISAEMAILGSLFIDRTFQSQITNDAAGSEVKVAQNDVLQVLVGEPVLDGVVRIDINRYRMRNTNAVSHFDNGAITESILHQRLGHPTHRIRGRTVDFGGIFS